MGLFQLANTNTFGQLVTAIAGLLGISNYLTDGPSLVANTELILTKPGTTLNVSSDAIIGNLSATNISTPTLYTTSLSVTGNIVASNLFAVGNKSVSPKTFTRAELSNTQIMEGFLYFGFNQVNASIITAQAWGVSNLSVTPNGSLTLDTLYANSVNLLDGTATLNTATLATGTIQTLQTSGVYNSSFVGSVSNSVLSNCTFSQTQGLHKANVGLSNVDNTSDATKNSATANLSNKTLMSPLVVTGNVSEHPDSLGFLLNPELPMQVASEFYANVSQLVHNPIINGRMDIWQRGNTSGVSQSQSLYQADRWYLTAQSDDPGDAPYLVVRQSNNVPSFANSSLSLSSSLEVFVDTGLVTTSTNDLYSISQRIEGYVWRLLAGKPLTLSFWVRSHLTGIYCVALKNGNDSNFIREYTIDTANTWEYKTLRFDASPDVYGTGVWNYTTGIGIELAFSLHTGSNFEYPKDQWSTGIGEGVQCATANQVNAVNSPNVSWFLTDVVLRTGDYQLLNGPYYTYPIIPRSLQEEEILCKRYYQKSFDRNTKPAANTGLNTGEHRFTTFKSGVVTMTSPTVLLPVALRTKTTTRTLYNPANTNNQVRDVTNNVDCNGSGLSTWSTDTLSIATAGHSSTAVGDQLAVHWTVDCEL